MSESRKTFIDRRLVDNYAYIYSLLHNLRFFRITSVGDVNFHSNNFFYSRAVLLFSNESLSVSSGQFDSFYPADRKSNGEYGLLLKEYITFKKASIGLPINAFKVGVFVNGLIDTDESLHLSQISFFILDCEIKKAVPSASEEEKRFLLSLYEEDGKNSFYKLFTVCVRSYRLRAAYVKYMVSQDLNGKNLYENFVTVYLRATLKLPS